MEKGMKKFLFATCSLAVLHSQCFAASLKEPLHKLLVRQHEQLGTENVTPITRAVLEKYGLAAEASLMDFHAKKMELLNKIADGGSLAYIAKSVGYVKCADGNIITGTLIHLPNMPQNLNGRVVISGKTDQDASFFSNNNNANNETWDYKHYQIERRYTNDTISIFILDKAVEGNDAEIMDTAETPYISVGYGGIALTGQHIDPTLADHAQSLASFGMKKATVPYAVYNRAFFGDGDQGAPVFGAETKGLHGVIVEGAVEPISRHMAWIEKNVLEPECAGWAAATTEIDAEIEKLNDIADVKNIQTDPATAAAIKSSLIIEKAVAEAEKENISVDGKLALKNKAREMLTSLVRGMHVIQLSIKGADGDMPFLLYRLTEDIGEQLPCLVFLHGGNPGASFRIETPETSIRDLGRNDMTYTLLPLINALVSRHFAVATITFRCEDGIKSSITQQIMDQIKELKKQPIGKIFLLGHSFGGYMMTQFLAQQRGWLKGNVDAVGIYAPAGVTETYAGGGWSLNYGVDIDNNNFLKNNAGYTGKFSIRSVNLKATALNDKGQPDSITTDEYMERFRKMHPFSDLIAIQEKILQPATKQAVQPFESGFTVPVYLFQGTGDSNTTPRQMMQLITAFDTIKFSNWQLFVYPDSLHWVHRIKETQLSGNDDLAQHLGGSPTDKKASALAMGLQTTPQRCRNLVTFCNDISNVLNPVAPPTAVINTSAVAKKALMTAAPAVGDFINRRDAADQSSFDDKAEPGRIPAEMLGPTPSAAASSKDSQATAVPSGTSTPQDAGMPAAGSSSAPQ
ncbi:hypothetical protein FACS189472_01860 [Alphaproteobacteria bacterium]|nr:hypothetical protein FACS189472_01860 [Alphaproteobacteria bacterium]